MFPQNVSPAIDGNNIYQVIQIKDGTYLGIYGKYSNGSVSGSLYSSIDLLNWYAVVSGGYGPTSCISEI
jgi:hypothetical protein